MKNNLRAILDTLFISKVRVKILQLFFSNPNERFHIRGVVREINEEINAVRRELLRLEGISLLAAEKKGNRIYYSLKTDFALYSEISSMIHKTTGLGEEVLSSINDLGEVSYVILTRSYLIGTHDHHEEIDLLVIGDIDMDALSALIQRAERRTEREINYAVLKESEFVLRKKRKDPFLLELLVGRKIVIYGNEDELVL